MAVLTALLMTVFVGFCGFAVDVGHWYLVKAQTQKAADAAALAAVVNLPDNFLNAQTTAAQFAEQNGFPTVSGTSVTTRPVVGDTGRLSVTVSTTVDNYFTGLFGVPTSTIASTGDAAYTPPLKMGSPCNRIGSDPDKQGSADSSACDSSAGGLWVNLNAPGTAKEEGDPFNTTTCSGFEDECAADGSNKEHGANGYFYDVTVKQAGPLKVEVFDAPWVDVGAAEGNQCNSAALQALAPTPADAKRYAFGDTSTYCTGDSMTKASPGSPHTAPVMNTTFTLRSSQGDPLAPETHDQVSDCRRTYPGYRPTDGAEFSKRLSPADPAYKPGFFGSFRKWSTLCSLGTVPAGTYVLQVESDDDINAANRFSLRATGANLSALTISGHGSMDLYANDKQQNSRFYLARTPTSAAGQTLHVRFFDTGECSSTCTLTVMAPGGSAATGCTNAGSLPISGCSFTPTPAFNGKWVELLVPVPVGYSCADADPAACWYRVKYSGGAPHDVTAWTATMDGQPVRIVP